MKVVRFRDGRYGLRSGFWPFYSFVDLKQSYYKWEKGSEYFFVRCKGSLEDALRAYHNLVDNGESVDHLIKKYEALK